MKAKKNSKFTRAFADLLFTLFSSVLPKRHKCFVLFPISVSPLNAQLSVIRWLYFAWLIQLHICTYEQACVCMCVYVFVIGTSVFARLFPICHKSNSNIYRRNYTPTDEQRDSLLNFLFFFVVVANSLHIYVYIYVYLYLRMYIYIYL